MVIYKFGGASVRNAASFRMLKQIVEDCSEDLIIVVSAMGKTTNQLEEIVRLARKENGIYVDKIKALENYHLEIVSELVPDARDPIHDDVSGVFVEIGTRIEAFRDQDFNLYYDQVVSLGEVLSTRIVSRYLQLEGLDNIWIDIRECLLTDSSFRDATVNYGESGTRLRKAVKLGIAGRYVLQGFIGSEKSGLSTTLGREGSDFTAAVLARIFNASAVFLWKDVQGIYNADPALFEEVTLLDRVSYQEMIELAYYGAKVIHPKTIKPLKRGHIPLYVKSFYYPEKPGTVIGDQPGKMKKVPITIIRDKQILISISQEDLSFISESHISKLFGLLYKFRLKANLMQHSAVSFSVCVDEPRGREVQDLIEILKKEFRVLYNDSLTLITIRHYTDRKIREVTQGRKLYVEQRSRSTVQFVTA